MMRQKITLPLPTSANNLHRSRPGGVYKTADYKAWMKEAGFLVIVARSKGEIKNLPPGPYAARLRWPINCAMDTDNPVKALFDLLRKMDVTPDDRDLHWYSAGRSARVEPGTCQVQVWPVDVERAA